MARFKAKLWYEGELIGEPIIAQLARDHDVIANIRRANVEDDSGWIVCELEGDEERLAAAIDWLRSRGIDVELVGDVVES
jgi:ABC-type methionine transport system ATPase subunit